MGKGKGRQLHGDNTVPESGDPTFDPVPSEIDSNRLSNSSFLILNPYLPSNYTKLGPPKTVIVNIRTGRQIDSAQLNLNTINSLATMHSSCMQVQIFCCNYKQAECDYTEGCLPAALALLPPPSSPSSSPLPSEPPPMTGSVARDSGIKGILGLLSCECVVCGVCLHTCISCHIGQSTAKHKQETLCIL